MNTCSTCKNWTIKQQVEYENGEVIVKWASSDGKGKCKVLGDFMTAPDFGCNSYQSGGPYIKSRFKTGAPWHHKVFGPCPDCKHPYCGYPNCTYQQCPGTDKCLGRGCLTDRPDDRCVGTGLVFYYDDGYIGENKTKLHPKEKELGRVEETPPMCPNCNLPIDLNWKVCPECGHRLKESTTGPMISAVMGGS